MELRTFFGLSYQWRGERLSPCNVFIRLRYVFGGVIGYPKGGLHNTVHALVMLIGRTRE